MNIIFFEKQKISELRNLLQDIHCNMLAPAETAFMNSVNVMDSELYGMGNVARLINDINNEFVVIEEAFFNNLSFLEILDDRYAGVENSNQRAIERLMADLALYAGEETAGELIPDIAVMVNRTLRYLFDNLVQGYEEQVKPVSLKSYVPNEEENYFISDASERNIISKYLTRLDFAFLSSLSHVYDFFEFGELNLLILNHMRDTTKFNPVKLDDEAIQMIIEGQKRRFPDLQEILPDMTDNELHNMSVRVANFAAKENIERFEETDKSIFADDTADYTARSKPDFLHNNDNDLFRIPTPVTPPVITPKPEILQEDDNALSYKPITPVITPKPEVSPESDNDLSQKLVTPPVITPKSEIFAEGDNNLSQKLVAQPVITPKPEIPSEGDNNLQHKPITPVITPKPEVSPESDNDLSQKLVTPPVITPKSEIFAEGDNNLSQKLATQSFITPKPEILQEDDNALSYKPVTPVITPKSEVSPESDNDLYQKLVTPSVITPKSEIFAEGDNNLSQKLAVQSVITPKPEIPSEGDNNLQHKPITPVITPKPEVSPEGDNDLPPISTMPSGIMSKSEIPSEGDNNLSQKLATQPVITPKSEILQEDDNALSYKPVTPVITPKSEVSPESDNDLYQKLVTPSVITPKSEIFAEGDNNLSQKLAAQSVITPKPEIPSEDDNNLQHKLVTSVITQKLEVPTEGDSDLPQKPVTPPIIMSKSEILAEGDNDLSQKLATSPIYALKPEVLSEDDNNLYQKSVTSVITPKSEIPSEGDNDLLQKPVTSPVIAPKTETPEEGDNDLPQKPETSPIIAPKTEIPAEGDNDLPQRLTTSPIITQKSEIPAEGDNNLPQMPVTPPVVTPKSEIFAEGDNNLTQKPVTPPAITPKLEISPDDNTDLNSIISNGPIITAKSESSSDSDNSLNDTSEMNPIATQKLSMADDDTSSDNITMTANIITEKFDMGLSGDNELDELRLVNVMGSSSFGWLKAKEEETRRFRTTKEFHFVEDDTEEQMDPVRVNKSAKTVQEAVKEDEGAEIFQESFQPTGRTITPSLFIEGVADELQLMEVAIRKQLKWEEQEFHAFLDFLYSLANTAEFPPTPMMIGMVYSEIINYIVINAFNKVESIQLDEDINEEEMNFQQQDFRLTGKEAIDNDPAEADSVNVNHVITDKEIIEGDIGANIDTLSVASSGGASYKAVLNDGAGEIHSNVQQQGFQWTEKEAIENDPAEENSVNVNHVITDKEIIEGDISANVDTLSVADSDGSSYKVVINDEAGEIHSDIHQQSFQWTEKESIENDPAEVNSVNVNHIITGKEINEGDIGTNIDTLSVAGSGGSSYKAVINDEAGEIHSNIHQQGFQGAEKEANENNEPAEGNSVNVNRIVTDKEIIEEDLKAYVDTISRSVEVVRGVAADILLDGLTDAVVAKVLAGMVNPKLLISTSDIFAGEDEIFSSSCGRFESLSGVSSPCSYEEISVPEPISSYADNSRQELLEQKIDHIAVNLAADAVVSSYMGVAPAQRVTISSAIPAFTTFERPSALQYNQASEPEQSNVLKKSSRSDNTAGAVPQQDDMLKSDDGDVYSVANNFRQNTEEDFVVEYSNNNGDLSMYLIDTAGGSTLGFLGGLLLSGDKDLEDKFLRIKKLPVHIFEEVIKNTYQSGIIQQAKKMAEMSDIFSLLSGGKAIVTTLDNVGSCFIG